MARINWHDLVPYTVARQQIRWEQRCAAGKMEALGFKQHEIVERLGVTPGKLQMLLARMRRFPDQRAPVEIWQDVGGDIAALANKLGLKQRKYAGFPRIDIEPPLPTPPGIEHAGAGFVYITAGRFKGRIACDDDDEWSSTGIHLAVIFFGEPYEYVNLVKKSYTVDATPNMQAARLRQLNYKLAHARRNAAPFELKLDRLERKMLLTQGEYTGAPPKRVQEKPQHTN